LEHVGPYVFGRFFGWKFGSSTAEQEKKKFDKSREARMMEGRSGEEHSGGKR